MQIIESTELYRNPKPHLRAVNAWHPTLVRINGDELLASFDLGQGPESLDYATYLSRSFDGGKSWSSPTRLLLDDIQPSTHTFRTTSLNSEKLVAMGTRLHRQDPEEGILNRENHGFVPMDVLLLESFDGGHRWSKPRVVDPPLTGPGFEMCHSILPLRDGRWLWPTSTLKDWNGEAPNGLKAVAFVSHDQGHSWPEHIDTFDDFEKGVIYWEQSITQMEDGRTIATAWALDDASGKSLPTSYRVASTGTEFGPSQLTGINAQTAKLLALDGDKLLCVYRRVDQPGLWANLVEMQGDRWINQEEIALWQGAETGMTGAASKSEELSQLKFGYPSLLRFSKDEVLIAFWCYEDGVFNIRLIRLRIEL